MKDWQGVFGHRVHMIPESGCWVFAGAWNSMQYGNVGVDKKNYLAHRLSYQLLVGPISSKAFLCHKCDVRSCINPNHLFVGTAKDNVEDMVRKRRHQFGEAQWMSRLTDEDVIRIRENIDQSDEQLAAVYGVTRAAVTLARNGKTWSHLPPRKFRRDNRARVRDAVTDEIIRT